VKDRIEHTEHKARRNSDPSTQSWSFGERRYGRTAAPSSNGIGPSVAAASSAGEAEAWTEAEA
jgi:hypothetical protein